jgi:hypothetical protein
MFFLLGVYYIWCTPSVANSDDDDDTATGCASIIWSFSRAQLTAKVAYIELVKFFMPFLLVSSF